MRVVQRAIYSISTFKDLLYELVRLFALPNKTVDRSLDDNLIDLAWLFVLLLCGSGRSEFSNADAFEIIPSLQLNVVLSRKAMSGRHKGLDLPALQRNVAVPQNSQKKSAHTYSCYHLAEWPASAHPD